MDKDRVLARLPYEGRDENGNPVTVYDLYKIAKERILNVNLTVFCGMEKPLVRISDQYCGLWLEHTYDAIFLSRLYPEYSEVARSTIEALIEKQTEDGQLPCLILDAARVKMPPEAMVRYSHIQEVVAFARLAYMAYELCGSREFLERAYDAAVKWVLWIRRNRMTRGLSLPEMFVGFDTGHDNSPRLNGMSYRGCQPSPSGPPENAKVLPRNDAVAPIIAVDMACNYYSNLIALSKMARELERQNADEWLCEAKEVKRQLFELCFDKEDCFFYDVDKLGNKRKYLSCTLFHLFMEGVLDRDRDKELIDELYRRHIDNPNEFKAPYPYPSMALCDPSTEGHATFNSWGYYSQSLTALRTTLWMDEYGYSAELDRLCEKFVQAWCENFHIAKLAQELDPITGVPTKSSEWYSSTILFFIYSVRRLVGGLDE